MKFTKNAKSAVLRDQIILIAYLVTGICGMMLFSIAVLSLTSGDKYGGMIQAGLGAVFIIYSIFGTKSLLNSKI